MAELIYVDEKGEEVNRKTKGRGRPPKGSVKQENGDFIVHPVADKPKTLYLTLDKTGRVRAKEVKGRGRTKPGYVLQTDGKHIGHWIMTKTPKARKESPVSA